MKNLIQYFLLVMLCGGFTIISCKKSNQEGIVKDIDGNIYHTITIGTQTWMVENLRTTHLNNGEPILEIKDNSTWGNSLQPSFSWHGYDSKNYKEPYGGLYNKLAVETGKLAPAGWHVPTDADWNELINYLGGSNIAGGKMKENGALHWSGNNTGSNESGFTAVGGGNVGLNGFFFFNSFGFYLTATQPLVDGTTVFILDTSNDKIVKNSFAGNSGNSVRCIKNP